MTALPPGSSIGILGGGQLGRMLALAAAKLGFDVHVFTPEMDSPAARVAAHTIIADYDDLEALEAFSSICDVITYEFENVPAATAQAVLDAGVTLYPGVMALEVSQDRVVEKSFLNAHGCETTGFVAVNNAADILEGLVTLGEPALLKTRREGYDGKGQIWIKNASEAESAFAALGGKPAILEARVDFTREASIIAVRGQNGHTVCYDMGENVHTGGILRTTTVPARVDAAVMVQAQQMAQTLLSALDYVGVMGIEFFVCADGALLVNEFAPRVHNSGHWTMDGCAASQFDNHIRAIAGWPLAAPARHADVVMHNLIGAEAHDWPEWAVRPHAHLHLYGKYEALPGRKMGHVNVCQDPGRAEPAKCSDVSGYSNRLPS